MGTSVPMSGRLSLLDRNHGCHTTKDVREGKQTTMNFKQFDRLRRNASPLELDLMEHYAAGKISRRNFTKRGVILGLSACLLYTSPSPRDS